MFNRDLRLELSFHALSQKHVVSNRALGLGPMGPPGALFLDTLVDEDTTGGRGKLVWEKGRHTVVMGVDLDRGRLDQALDAGALLQAFGAPASSRTHPDIDTWAFYVNDTLLIDRWSFTPGIRYDHDSITGSFVSPSLGLTYRLAQGSVLRASLARGFTLPPLSTTSGGGLYLDPNPALEPEEVRSYQAGIESGALNMRGPRPPSFTTTWTRPSRGSFSRPAPPRSTT